MAFNNILDKLTKAKDFDEVKDVLVKANSYSFDSNSSAIYDQTNQSSTANLRNIIKKASEKQITDRIEYLGVVLKVEQDRSLQIPFKVYVEIPGLDPEGILHPDLFADNSIDYSKIQHKLFYPSGLSVLRTDYPVVGDIVRVRVAKNYFNTSNVNPLDNVYLGIYFHGAAISPSSDKNIAPQAKKSLQISSQKARNSLFKRQPSEAPQRNQLISLPFRQADAEKFKITSFPGTRINPFTGQETEEHKGLDISMPSDTPVLAVCEQIITYAGDTKGAGGIAVIAKSIDGRFTYSYCHLSKTSVKNGNNRIQAGTEIGRSGTTGRSTGPHLHLTMRENGNIVSPLFFLKGTVFLKDTIQKDYGFQSNQLSLPLKYTKDKNTLDGVDISSDSKQPSLEAKPQNTPSSTSATNASPPQNRPKLLIKDFSVDTANGVRRTSEIGSKTIKVREDIIPALQNIKEKLNKYNIALTCQEQNIDLLNENISLLAKVGLEVRLNPFAGLSSQSNLDIDDYFIGPDYSKPIGNGYKLIVYGNVKRNLKYFSEVYIPEKKIIEVYDPKSLNPNGPPTIKKIFKNVINITKIFEDQGFVQVLPKQDFFLYSDLSKSNWNIFQIPSKIIVGYSYKELLSSVYYDKGEAIWKLPDLLWDGNKFI